MREEAIEKMHAIVEAADDPLSVLVGFVLDENLGVQTRMSAAAICLPYLYPRLSATTVDARVTNISVDAAAVIEKLNARLERIASPGSAGTVDHPQQPPMESEAKDEGES